MQMVTATAVPAESALQSFLVGADFADAYQAKLADPALPPVEIFRRAFRATPGWVARLMFLRNRLARLVGLKDVGDMRGDTGRGGDVLRTGDRLGIFNVVGQSDTELLLGIDDSHLDVRVSILKRADATAGVGVASTTRKRKGRRVLF